MAETARCADCGMPLEDQAEYHPWEACQMYRQSYEPDAVRRIVEERRLLDALRLHQETKLQRNRRKASWLVCSLEYLHDCLVKEVGELVGAVKAGAPAQDVWSEAADVANFAAMLADRYQALKREDADGA